MQVKEYEDKIDKMEKTITQQASSIKELTEKVTNLMGKPKGWEQKEAPTYFLASFLRIEKNSKQIIARQSKQR